ncbi:MAG TPA: class I SAM-dependent methyltransferase [Steroidobacteraceae bacterium]|jgi:2-polyprenyl-6-hydroxyphenyl methylase/3-demethylubiquinone-9 3-methyltransferase
MSKSADLLEQASHFAFGKNWASYSKLVTDERVQEAIASLRRLAGGELTGKRFLDIGCGSGLHSLAALRLGAVEVVALDIDPDSVATTRNLLQQNAPGLRWSVMERSIFDPQISSLGRFDFVYSWGVLHHTGDMYRALRAAAGLVAAGGSFIFALYRRTPLCWFWKIEKRWYSKASPSAQARAQAAYLKLFKLLNRRTFKDYVANYGQVRGMDFYHDVHDWLGGWPYESISPEQTERLMGELGLRRVRSFLIAGRATGVLGSGNDEYVYGRA